MRNLYVPALITSALLMASCTAPATNSNVNMANSNLNASTSVDMKSSQLNAANANMNSGTGSTTSAGKTFTAAEVATHTSETDCYAIVSGEVYDLTKWIARHPGGPEAIKATCGKDISDMTHPGGVPMSQQVQKVQQYKIGTLSK